MRRLLILMLLANFGCESSRSSSEHMPVTLEALSNEGWPVNVRSRLGLSDIRVGRRSVIELFEPSPSVGATWGDWLLGRNRPILIKLRDNAASVEALRNALLSEYQQGLMIELVDDKQYPFQCVIPEDRVLKNVRISLELSLTPCEEISQIVYSELNETLRNSVTREGETTEEISLDEMFGLLLREKIEPFMDSLSPLRKRHECFQRFELLKWLRGDGAHGFVQGEYGLHDGLIELLRPTIKAILDVRSVWDRSDFVIRVTGFADNVAVDGIALSESETGLVRSVIGRLDSVRVKGCLGDALLSGQPVYIELGASDGDLIRYVRTNCELGAVRSYIAVKYLQSQLGDDRIDYQYASGGVRTEDRDLAKNRRVRVDLTVKASKVEQN